MAARHGWLLLVAVAAGGALASDIARSWSPPRDLSLLASTDPPAAGAEPRLILTEAVRERMLRYAEKSLRQDKVAADGWHSAEAERMLERLLQRASSLVAAEDAAATGRVRRASAEAQWGDAETEALWLLCRTQLGGIEATLQALESAATRVRKLNTRWHSSAISLWLPSVSHAGSAPLLGSARSRFGIGARHRALLRSERLLMVQAGMLHDLRVAILRAGGEWLEYGSWLGGPPVRGMEWDVQISPERRRELRDLCEGANRALTTAADRLASYGPYALYRSPPWALANTNRQGDGHTVSIPPTRAGMLASTSTHLRAVREIRRALGTRRIPRELQPPLAISRGQIVPLALLIAAVLWAYTVVRSAERRAAALVFLVKMSSDVGRFWTTHVAEPVRDIAHELYGVPRPILDSATAAASRDSFHRSLEAFAREVLAGTDTATVEAAAAQAAGGSMETVNHIFERDSRRPLNGLLRGELPRTLLLQIQHLKVLLEEQVEYADQTLKRNDFTLQIMAVVPALLLGFVMLTFLRALYQRVRTSSPRGPIEDIRRELVTIQRMLNRAAGAPPAGSAALTKYEASPMDVATAGELVFRVMRLRAAGQRWLRGWLRSDVLQDARELLDSGRLSALQRAQIANSLLRRLDNSNPFFHHW